MSLIIVASVLILVLLEVRGRSFEVPSLHIWMLLNMGSRTCAFSVSVCLAYVRVLCVCES